MHSVDRLELSLNKVRFIAELALIAECKQSELKLALSMISEIAEVHIPADTNNKNIIGAYCESN